MVTLGAYTIVSGVQGESLELKANPYHFRGKPKIEKATVEYSCLCCKYHEVCHDGSGL